MPRFHRARRIVPLFAALWLGATANGGAQIPGMPVWNNPRGGSGVALAGDYGRERGSGDVWAARLTLGLGSLELGGIAGTGSAAGEDASPWGGTAALRLAGGGLSPAAINAQVGYATARDGGDRRSRVTAAAGAGLTVPIPGLEPEVWISPGLRFYDGWPGGSDESRFGYAAGLNAGFGLLGIHAAVDREDGRPAVWGVGLSLSLGAPVP